MMGENDELPPEPDFAGDVRRAIITVYLIAISIGAIFASCVAVSMR